MTQIPHILVLAPLLVICCVTLAKSPPLPGTQLPHLYHERTGLRSSLRVFLAQNFKDFPIIWPQHKQVVFQNGCSLRSDVFSWAIQWLRVREELTVPPNEARTTGGPRGKWGALDLSRETALPHMDGVGRDPGDPNVLSNLEVSEGLEDWRASAAAPLSGSAPPPVAVKACSLGRFRQLGHGKCPTLTLWPQASHLLFPSLRSSSAEWESP